MTATETYDEARVMPAHKTAQRATEMVVDWLESLTDAEIVDSFFLHCERAVATLLERR